MSDWRDDLSEEALVEMDTVLTASIAFAKQMLETQGSFFPYSVTLSDENQTEMATAPASSTDPFADLEEGLVAGRTRLHAAAVASNVHLESIGSDALRIDIEHRDGARLTVVVPYERKKLRKKVELGEMQSMSVDPRIWGA